ncbi:solute carrier family 2, facilitated glucose transporter member 10-like [Diadema setosum]|uniref:solute carrier family 2, facilitated glucose transporter member 10-like n=1 Tax=Diadema setosum TaxID=31175 RepID=UPI003B3AF1D0
MEYSSCLQSSEESLFDTDVVRLLHPASKAVTVPGEVVAMETENLMESDLLPKEVSSGDTTVFDRNLNFDTNHRFESGSRLMGPTENPSPTVSDCEERLIEMSIVAAAGTARPGRKTTPYLIVAVIMAALGGILFGYDIGIISGALLQLKVDFSLSCFQQEMVVSSMLIGATVGSMLGGFVIDRIGRRWTIIINSAIFTAGAVILTAATSYAILVIGRLIVGFAVSVSAIGECIYISEIAPKERRGQMVSVNELGIASGLLLAYLINFCFINVSSGWRFMFAFSAVPAVVQGVGMFFLPPSPRFLVRRLQNSRAENVLMKLRGSKVVRDELAEIQASVSQERSYSFIHLFQSVDNIRWRMVVGAGLVFLQQISGQTNVVYYAPTILKDLGYGDNFSATLATVGLGMVKVAATCICVMLVDKYGRRRFLLIGASAMAAFIIILGILTQTLPASSIKDPCEATSHPAEFSSNISANDMHSRDIHQYYGDEVDSLHQSNIVGNWHRERRRELFDIPPEAQALVHKGHATDISEDDNGESRRYMYIEQRNLNLRGHKRLRREESLTNGSVSLLNSTTTSSPVLLTTSSLVSEMPSSLVSGTLLSSVQGTTLSPVQGTSSSPEMQTQSRMHHHSSATVKPSTTVEQGTTAPVSVIPAHPTEADAVVSSTFQSISPSLTREPAEDAVTVSKSAKGMALLSLILYVGFYSFGFGPISWLVISEIFPADIRGRASSFTTVFNWGTNVIISLTFLDVLRKFGISWTFLMYGIVCCVSVVFIYLVVPETKNRSLEQISDDLRKRSGMRQLLALRSVCSQCECCRKGSTPYRPSLLVTDDSIM